MFNKYLVTQVSTTDTVGGSAAITSDYSYIGDPGWRYDDDPLKTPTETQSWGQWRGYEKTTVTTGSSVDGYTRTRFHTFRGLFGDKLAAGGTKTTTATTTDGVTYQDTDWRAGRILEQTSLASDAVTIVRTKRYAFTGVNQGTSIVDGRTALWTGVNGTRERHQVSGSTYRDKVTSTSYNANLLVEDQIDRGWEDDLTDDRCTRTLYATPNTSTWIFAFPKEQTLRASDNCAAGTITSQSQWDYDGLSYGATPTRGNVTKHRQGIDGSNWATTETGYDAQGRVISVKDPNANITTTAYTPSGPSGGFNAHPTSMTSTKSAQVTTLSLDPERIGSPRTVTDPNGKATTITYDPLGRTWKVWRPTESLINTPSVEYAYELIEHSQGYGVASAPQVATYTLQKEAATDEFLFEYTILDGLGRERQTATFSPGPSGSTITQTEYDSRGLVKGVTHPEGEAVWPNQMAAPIHASTRRPTRTIRLAGPLVRSSVPVGRCSGRPR